jgi:hypothetical protein
VRELDADTLAALNGSRPADTLTVWAWRDGVLVVPEPLEVVEWSGSEAAGDTTKIGQTLSLTVADPDGTLGAWRFDDALGVAGTLLQVIYRVGGAGSLNYGWFRVTDNEPDERVDWRVIDEYSYDEPDAVLPAHKRQVPIVTAVVKLEATDLTIGPDRDKFEAPQSPGAGATVIGEFKRLTGAYFRTVVEDGITDLGVSRKLVYDKERLEACQDLLSRINARYRMGGDGECHVYRPGTVPVWRAAPGSCLVSVSRKQSLDGLYNRWVVEGKDSKGKVVRARASIESGPLRYGGPHGRSQYAYSSEMITSHAGALAYAEELRAKFLNSLAVELTVEVAPRPELQAGDRIEIGYPLAAGHVAYFPGEITGIRRGGSPIPTVTSLTVSCSYYDVSAALSRTDWAGYLTADLPPLTWDRIPATWGTAPLVAWNDL